MRMNKLILARPPLFQLSSPSASHSDNRMPSDRLVDGLEQKHVWCERPLEKPLVGVSLFKVISRKSETSASSLPITACKEPAPTSEFILLLRSQCKVRHLNGPQARLPPPPPNVLGCSKGHDPVDCCQTTAVDAKWRAGWLLVCTLRPNYPHPAATANIK